MLRVDMIWVGLPSSPFSSFLFPLTSFIFLDDTSRTCSTSPNSHRHFLSRPQQRFQLGFGRDTFAGLLRRHRTKAGEVPAKHPHSCNGLPPAVLPLAACSSSRRALVAVCTSQPVGYSRGRDVNKPSFAQTRPVNCGLKISDLLWGTTQLCSSSSQYTPNRVWIVNLDHLSPLRKPKFDKADAKIAIHSGVSLG